MANAAFTQSSFLGGEWSPYAQGRIDIPLYRQALATCENSIVMEEGSVTRRPGTYEAGITDNSDGNIVREMALPDNNSAILDFAFNSGTSASTLRIWIRPYTAPGNRPGAILAPIEDLAITSISDATPAEVTTQSAALTSWATDDDVMLYIGPGDAEAGAAVLTNRLCQITVIDQSHFTLYDVLTEANVDGATCTLASGDGASAISRIQKFVLPYTTAEALESVKLVQSDETVFLLCAGYAPQILTATFTYDGAAIDSVTFTLAAMSFEATDGPYLDPPLGESQTGNGMAYIVKGADWEHLTLTITDSSYSFSAGDVGKGIRIWTQPPPYNSGLYGEDPEYGVGNVCTFNGAFYTSATAWSYLTDAVAPGSSQTDKNGQIWIGWAPAPQQGQWVAGYIASVASASSASIVMPSAPDGGGTYELNGCFDTRNASYWTDGGETPANTTGCMIDTYQIGAFGDGVYPSCGCWQEGRLWLGGAIVNRFDATTSGNVATALTFSPTDDTGAVLDSSGIAETMFGTDLNMINWMITDHQGIVFGSASGEFLITASSLNDPLTPTSVQCHLATKYRSTSVQPVRAGLGVLFPQLVGRKMMEYVSDVFSGKFIGRHINEFAKHIAPDGFDEIAYMEELAPVLWANTNDGNLTGCTYRRISGFTTEPPVMSGWHRHPLGSGRTIVSLCHVSGLFDVPDGIAMVTKAPGGQCYIEVLSPIFDENAVMTDAMFLDGAHAGAYSVFGSDGGTSSLTLYGLWTSVGNTVTAFIGGLDCGDYVVSDSGTITVPYGSDPDGLLTANYLYDFGGLGIGGNNGAGAYVSAFGTPTLVTIPVALGFNYTSTGEIVRPATQAETQSPTGSSPAKVRRPHQYGLLVAGAVGGASGLQVKASVSGTWRAANFRQDSQAVTDYETLYTGPHWDTLEAGYGLDGAVTWRMTRPYPATICSVSTFLQTQDR